MSAKEKKKTVGKKEGRKERKSQKIDNGKDEDHMKSRKCK